MFGSKVFYVGVLWYYNCLQFLIRRIGAGEVMFHWHKVPGYFDICAAKINTSMLRGNQLP